MSKVKLLADEELSSIEDFAVDVQHMPGNDLASEDLISMVVEIRKLRSDKAILVAACERIIKWLDQLAAAATERAKDGSFVTLQEANRLDAKNYRATAASVQAAIDKTKETDDEQDCTTER